MEAIESLRHQQFSLMIDESNSRKDPVLAVLCRYFERGQGCSVTKFVTLLPCPWATAEAIFTSLDEFFRQVVLNYKSWFIKGCVFNVSGVTYINME